MSVVNNILVGPVNLIEAYNYVGVTPTNGEYSIGAIVRCPQINPESIRKPIKGNTAFFGDCLATLPDTAWDDPNTSGWEIVRDGNVSGQTYACFNMRLKEILSTDAARLTDLNGYDKNAKGPALTFAVSNISGYGQGSGFMGSGDTVLTMTAKITFPTIRPGAVPIAPFNPSTGQNVQLVRYINNSRIVIWELPKDPELPNKVQQYTAAQWATQYGGKTLDVTVTESTDLPPSGSSKDYTYFLEINGCHKRLGKIISFTARGWRQFERFIGGAPNPDLWEHITPTKTENYGEIFYSSVRRLKGRNTGNSYDSGLYLNIDGLYNVGNPPNIEIYAGDTLIAKCNNSVNVTYYNGAKQGYASPQLNSYTFNFNGTNTTVQALDCEIRVDSIAWNAAITLKSVNKLGT